MTTEEEKAPHPHRCHCNYEPGDSPCPAHDCPHGESPADCLLCTGNVDPTGESIAKLVKREAPHPLADPCPQCDQRTGCGCFEPSAPVTSSAWTKVATEEEKAPHPLDALRAYVAQCEARAHDERLRYESEADAVLNTAEQCLALATEALAAVERELAEARATIAEMEKDRDTFNAEYHKALRLMSARAGEPLIEVVQRFNARLVGLRKNAEREREDHASNMLRAAEVGDRLIAEARAQGEADRAFRESFERHFPSTTPMQLSADIDQSNAHAHADRETLLNLTIAVEQRNLTPASAGASERHGRACAEGQMLDEAWGRLGAEAKAEWRAAWDEEKEAARARLSATAASGDGAAATGGQGGEGA